MKFAPVYSNGDIADGILTFLTHIELEASIHDIITLCNQLTPPLSCVLVMRISERHWKALDNN